MKKPIRSWRLLAAVLALVCAAAATSAAYATSAKPASHSALRAALAGKPHPATKKQWAKIVAQAKKEGSVTLYTSQNPLFLADTVKAFKARYGITLTVNRNIDGVLTQQVSAEESSGKVNADVVVIASKPTVLGFQKAPNLWATNEVGPDLYKKAYNRKWFGGPGKANMVGEAILGIGWNTSLYPKTPKDLPGLLDPSLKGKLGVVNPTSPSLVDWYLWVESRFGKAYLTKLAAQKPKIYTSSLPMTQAVASGEISVGSFVATSALDLKAQGAPINFVVPGGRQHGWNAPWWGMVLKKAPHPAAAQLLMDYLVTREGQATSQQKLGVVLKGIPGTFYIKPRTQNLLALTPSKVTAFQNYWHGLFG